MTVTTTTNLVIYVGNGVTTEYAFPFKVLDEDHLVVAIRDAETKVTQEIYDLGVEYSVSGIGDPAGIVTLTDPITSDYELVILRIVPYRQDLDIVNAGGFYPETVEEQLDLIVMQIQQLADIADRALTVPLGEEGLVIPADTERENKFLAFDIDGNAVASSGTGADIGLREDLASIGLGLGSYMVVRPNGESVEAALTELDDGLADSVTQVQLSAEVAERVAGDEDLSERIDLLESTTVSGMRSFATWAELDAAFEAYNPATAYSINDTVLDQDAFWLAIAATTGNDPPVLPTALDAFWRLITAAPAGLIATVPASDTGFHNDPVEVGNPEVDNAGVYSYSLDPEGWKRISELDSQIAEGFATSAANSAAILGDPADAGSLPTKTANAGGAIEWASRSALSLQPREETDVTDTNAWQEYCSVSSPDTRFTATVVGDEVEIENIDVVNIFPAGIVSPLLLRTNGVFTFRGRTESGDLGVTSGVAIYLSQTNPTLGGAAVQSALGDVHITIRGNGTCQVLDYLWNAAYPGATISDANVPPHTTEEVVASLEMTSTTTAILYLSIGGQQVAPKTITGLPANRYFGGAVRLNGPTGTVGYISELSSVAPSFDLPKRIYISGGATGGTGGHSLPYGSFREAVDDFRVDTFRRTLDISLKGGVIPDSLPIDMTRWREVTIRGLKGQRPIIKPVTLIETVWTNIGGTEVWHTDKPFYFDGNRSYGTLINVKNGNTLAFGRTGMFTGFEQGIFGRNAANVAAADASFARGTISVHTTGALDGQILCRMHDGSDPNDAVLEFTAYAYGISAIASNESNGWNVGRINIEGIDIHGAFLAGINLRRVNYHLEDVKSECHGFYAFELDQSAGRAYGLRAEATGADGFHWSGAAPASARPLRSELFDCWAYGQLNFNEFDFWGDGFSNHTDFQHPLALFGCGSVGAGKSAIASSGAIDAHNFVGKDAWSGGVELYGVGTDSASSEINLFGGELIGNDYNLYCHNEGTANNSRTINARNLLMQDGVKANAYASSDQASSSATINLRDSGYITTGAPPTDGNKKLSGAYSVINVTTSTPAT